MKIGRYILILIILFLVSYYNNSITIRDDVTVHKWDSYSVFFQHMSRYDSVMLRLYLKLNYQKVPTLYPGVFRFTEELSYNVFLQMISVPPQSVSVSVTLLEWWSSIDYDNYLFKKWLINQWEYRSYIQDLWVIDRLRSRYDFLPSEIVSLEWFLYPDTYLIDVNKWNVVEQLVWKQLDAFYNKVWWPDPSLFTWYSKKLRSDWFSFNMGTYSIIKLASIIENEEKNNENKQTIAWLFLNRIDQRILLGADITLCYGKWMLYEDCSPIFIAQHIAEKNNPYNTRTNQWLPPTPISNPSVRTIAAVLVYQKTPYLFYLHDRQGMIHYAITLDEHNNNKSLFIQ